MFVYQGIPYFCFPQKGRGAEAPRRLPLLLLRLSIDRQVDPGATFDRDRPAG